MKRNSAPFLWNGCAVLAEYARHVSIQLELVSDAFDLEHRNIQDTFYANDKALVQMDTLRFGLLCLGILSLLAIQVPSIFVLVCTS